MAVGPGRPSPDGGIVYSTFGDGNLWRMGSDGSNPKQLTSNTGGTNLFPRVSSDGRYIVFRSDRTGSPQIWRMDIDGNNPKQLTESPLAEEFSDYSLDAKWVFYGKWGPERGVWKVPIEGGNSVRINNEEVQDPAVSPDGHDCLRLRGPLGKSQTRSSHHGA